ncbi:MAG: sorbosone dehydrogenase family protein [Oligoflexales bacterium]
MKPIKERFTAWHRIRTVLCAFVLAGVLWNCTRIKSGIVALWSGDYVDAKPAAALNPEFVGKDKGRQKIPVDLTRVASGFGPITEVSFVPGQPGVLVVLEKAGELFTYDMAKSKKQLIAKIPVQTDSEEGLLGIAFHPDFLTNKKFYLNYIPESKQATRVSEWLWQGAAAKELKTLLEIDQPYPNHNGGCLRFGPDGYLYIGMGDGGWRGDPHKHGQNPETLLAAMLRIDVNKTSGKKPYGIPVDNPPFKGKQSEVWAIGLRNPWRFSFDDKSRLIVADVGQDKWEEISIAEKGDNLGWNIKEAYACYDAKQCSSAGLKDPFATYGREDGVSITGGFQNLNPKQSSLYRKYIFGDFAMGRIWAVDLPDKATTKARADLISLGKWPIQIPTFARDSEGSILVANFGGGDIYRIEEKKSPK